VEVADKIKALLLPFTLLPPSVSLVVRGDRADHSRSVQDIR
jgi:hypothetical protein